MRILLVALAFCAVMLGSARAEQENIRKARELFAAGKYVECAAAAEAYLQKHENDFDAQELLISAAVQSNNIGRLRQQYLEDSESPLPAKKIWGCVGRAILYFKTGNGEWGQELACRALALADEKKIPVPPQLHYYLGNYQSGRGVFKEAEVSVKKALEIRKDYPEALFELAYLRDIASRGVMKSEPKLRREKIKEALALLDRVIDNCRVDQAELKLRACLCSGDILMEMGDSEAALKRYRDARPISPENFHKMIDLGAVLMDQKKTEEAREVWRERIALLGDGSPWGLSSLRRLLLSENKAVDFSSFVTEGKPLDYFSLVYDLAPKKLDAFRKLDGELYAFAEESFDAPNGKWTARVEGSAVRHEEQGVYFAGEAVLALIDQDGVFQRREKLGFDHFQTPLVVKDLNGDGAMEIVAAGWIAPNELVVKIFGTKPEWKTTEFRVKCVFSSNGVMFFDADGDGKLEAMCIEGPDNWLKIYSATEKGFESSERKHKRFFKYYLETYDKLPKDKLTLQMRERLETARALFKNE